MKYPSIPYITTLIILSLVTIGCQPGESEETAEIDMDSISSVRTAIKEKTQELSSLQAEINSLNDQLKKIDPTAKKAKVPVEVKTLELSTFESYSTFQANVMSDDLGMASSETGGRVTSLLVNEGDYVNSGQLIANVDLSTIKYRSKRS